MLYLVINTASHPVRLPLTNIFEYIFYIFWQMLSYYFNLQLYNMLMVKD